MPVEAIATITRQQVADDLNELLRWADDKLDQGLAPLAVMAGFTLQLGQYIDKLEGACA